MYNDRIFEFVRHNGEFDEYLHITGYFSSLPHEVLKLYIDWYNSEDGYFKEENKILLSVNDFEFVRSFCTLDFYEESKKIYYEKQDIPYYEHKDVHFTDVVDNLKKISDEE